MPDSRSISLPRQFFLAGFVVMLAAMAIVGFWVTARIEQAVVQNSALSAAIYADSFISPLSQDFARDDDISEPAKQALTEIFRTSRLSERVVSYKIWKPGGLVVYSNDPEIIGRQFEPTDELEAAWRGEVAGSFEDLDDEESAAEAQLGIPLLEVYTPIWGTFTGEIIAVAEFYQNAEELSVDLATARRSAWFLVGATFLASGAILFGIVNAGGRIIIRQAEQLENRLAEAEEMGAQNLALKAAAISATSRSMAQADRYLRQLGADLHDGPAQQLALANLRLDTAFESADALPEAANDVRNAINTALQEVRDISRGLATPDLEKLSIDQIVGRASQNYHNDNLLSIETNVGISEATELTYTQKLATLRFLQETLSNASRYAVGSSVGIDVKASRDELVVKVQDDGPGFDPEDGLGVRDDGGQGLPGLRDRAESLGGRLSLVSRPGAGTCVELKLPLSSGGAHR